MVELKTEAEIDGDGRRRAPSSPKRCAPSSTTPRPAAPPPTSTASPPTCWPSTARGSPFLDYHPRWAPMPFPAVLCVSVNDAVVHGIPTDQVLADGDLVSVDFGATLRGWCGDAARSFIVGTPRAEDAALIAATDAALAAGIAAVRPGNTLGDVGHAIADGRPQRGLRHARRPRRARHRPHHARGSARAQRRPPRQGHDAATRTGHRHRADADRRRHRRLHPRPRRLDAAHRDGRPGRAQ